MNCICFVTNEIFPVTPGGAGSLIFNLARQLLSEQQRVVLLLNVSKAAFDRFRRTELDQLPNPKNCRIYHVDELCRAAPFEESDFQSRFVWESARYDYACRQVYEQERPDRIEFVDYNGPAYAAICAKIAGLSYQTSLMTVRMHGPVELIDRFAMAKPLDFNRLTSYALEQSCFRLAEEVLYPTPSFIQAYYSGLQPTWLGRTVCSPPTISMHPSPTRETAEANVVLFYGRLFAVKGVDRFVDAAVQMLASQPASPTRFCLVGYDSMEPPDLKSDSYMAYLWQRIPAKFRDRFLITGHLKWQELNDLLPEVKFAVIPSYFESYSFAAHELRRAGIPLIISDIPAFRDHFIPEVDAVFFDGAVQDLAAQMIRLDQDANLRGNLARAPIRPQVGQFNGYLAPTDAGWVAEAAVTGLKLSVWILEDAQSPGSTIRTLESLAASAAAYQSLAWEIWRLKPGEAENASGPGVWLFGERYECFDDAGNPVAAGEPHTTNALLILRAGDELAADFIPRCLDTLARHPQVAYVGSWKRMRAGQRAWLQTHPMAAMLDLAPLEIDSLFSRCVMRTPPGLALDNLFDRHARDLGEVAYLWNLDRGRSCGIQIPQMMVTQDAENPPVVDENGRAYVLMQASRDGRAGGLARYLAMLAAGYFQSWLPLQAVWAEKGGYSPPPSGASARGMKSIFPQETWRRRIARRLSSGGELSQRMLAGLSRIWFSLKSFRHEK